MRKVLRFAFLMLIMLIPVSTRGQYRYALLIGIGDYPEGSGWNKIHGNNDIQIIDKALKRQGFSESNIVKLTDSAATKSNILNSFNLLLERCNEGDIVYIHFSGHGQLVTDIDGDEEDGFDESWIPYDACKTYQEGIYVGQNHLVDDELNALLMKVREHVGTKGKIIVIADACHSGSGSRALRDEETFVRGTAESFVIPYKKSDIKNNVPRSTEWLFVAACKSYQSNYEYRTPECEYYGILSYIIAGDSKKFDSYKYNEVLKEWDEGISNYSRYPQNLDNEGQPCRNNSYLF